MKLVIAISTLLVGCAAKPEVTTLFPNAGKSPEFQDGFHAGFYEGLTFNTQQKP